jgi:hypothetical protein
MTRENEEFTPQNLLLKINEYFDKINEMPELKDNFQDFDKYYPHFVKNKGVEEVLQRKKLSKKIKDLEEDIKQKQNSIKDLDFKITQKENLQNELNNKIGNEETEETEATGLYKDIADLKRDKEEMESDIEDLESAEQEQYNSKTKLIGEINILKKEKEELEKEIGNEETEETEATGLYKDIVDLTSKKEELESSYEEKSEELKEKHNNLLSKLELQHKDKIDNLNKEYSEKNNNLRKMHLDAKTKLDSEVEAREVQIKNLDDEVQNVKDLTELKKENKKHINLYWRVSISLLIALGLIMIITICGFWGNADKYIGFVNKNQDLKPLDMISFAFSFLIIKLPFAIIFAFLLAGGFSVLRSCINNYESIHKEIRDISSIYAITGRMNAESVLIIKQIKQYDEEEIKAFLDGSNEKDRKHLKERLKWEQISDYLSSRGKSNIAEDREERKVEIPNNWLAILVQITKMIKVIKKD